VRTLHRFHLNDIILVVVEAPFEVDHVGLESAHQHAERLVIHRRRQPGIDAKTLVLYQCAAAAYTDCKAAAAKMVEHAYFFVEAQGMMKREDVDKRADPDLVRTLDRRRQEHARAPRHAERRRMVLRHMIGVKTRVLDEFEQAQAFLEKLTQRPTVAVKVIEDRKLQHARGSVTPA